MSEESEFEVVVHPLDDGSFWAEVANLPGCLTQAANYTDILARIRDAFDACSNATPPASTGRGLERETIDHLRSCADLAQSLRDAGWQEAAEGAFHTVFACQNHTAAITVIKDADVMINDGLRAALVRLFAD